MRIGLVTDYYLPTLGGVQTAVKAHREELTALGHEVTIFAPLSEESTDSSIVRLPTSRFAPDGYPLAYPPRAVAEVIREETRRRRIEVLHVHTEMIGAMAAHRVAHELGVALVQTMHGRIDVYTRHVLPVASVTTIPLARLHHRYIPQRNVRILGRDRYTRTRLARRMWGLMVAQANNADHVIVPSAHFATKLRAQGVSSPTNVLSNGLEQSVIDAIGDVFVRRFDPASALRIVWVGRLSPEKRPDIFVNALTSLEGVEADMFGDGIARRRIRRLARVAGGGRVTVHGSVSQSEVLRAMRDAHVVVSTSFDFDNQPMVILEAIASGVPVIVSDPDLGELLPPNGGAVTSDPSADALAAVIRELRAHPDRIATMSAATVDHRHTTAHATGVHDLLGIYDAAIATAAKRR